MHIPWPQPWRTRWRSGKAFSFSFRDLLVSAVLYTGTVILCLLLRKFDPHNDTSYVAVLFLLDVFLTAMFTDGYLFSVITAVAGVLGVDYIFTAPYWAISFTVVGFPLTFLVMMVISVVTGAMTSRAKQHDAMEQEASRQRLYADLLRAVSHDIRTPLTGIVGATSVLLENDLTETQRQELLRDANEDAQWLIRVVENLLSITRIGVTEQSHIHKVPALAEEVVEDAAAKFRRRYPSVPLELLLSDEVRLVPMEELLIVQVLLNLMENAVLHGGNSLTCIRVGLTYTASDAVFTVSDDGVGIPPAKLPHLFDSSVLSVQNSDKRRGMGIGLSVCRTIVKAHNGTITGENRAGGGTEFTITLPLKEESHENQG